MHCIFTQTMKLRSKDLPQSNFVLWTGSNVFTGSSMCSACPLGKFSGFQGSVVCSRAPYPYNQPPINFSEDLCAINKSRHEILDMKNQGLAWIGGLGKLTTSHSRVWLCLNSTFPDTTCPTHPDLACYVYLISSSKFTYYGPNSYLCLVPKS